MSHKPETIDCRPLRVQCTCDQESTGPSGYSRLRRLSAHFIYISLASSFNHCTQGATGDGSDRCSGYIWGGQKQGQWPYLQRLPCEPTPQSTAHCSAQGDGAKSQHQACKWHIGQKALGECESRKRMQEKQCKGGDWGKGCHE